MAEIRDALAEAYPAAADDIADDVPRVVEGLVDHEVLECP